MTLSLQIKNTFQPKKRDCAPSMSFQKISSKPSLAVAFHTQCISLKKLKAASLFIYPDNKLVERCPI